MARYEKYAQILSNLGYDVTPLNGKVPILKGWQDRPDTALDFKKHKNSNIGLVTGGKHNIIAVDIDVSHIGAVAIIKTLSEDLLGSAPERIGNAPKTMFVYRCSEPFKKSKTAIYDINNQDSCVEVLAEGQQFVASGKHPDTKKNYSWPNDNLLEIPPSELTEVTAEDINNFIQTCNTALADYGSIKSKSLNRNNGSTSKYQFAANEQTTEYDKLLAALTYIDNNDLHYDDWVYVGFGICGAVGEDGLDLFHRWSKRSDKYDPTETDRLWNSIGTVTTIGAGSIFHMANQNGFDLQSWDKDLKEQEAVAEKAEERAQSGELKATPLGDIVVTQMPRREFLYGKHLIKKYVSTTVAPGGGSKTTLLLTDAIALVTNRNLVGNEPKFECKAWHYNLEDPIDELRRRAIAICIKFGIDHKDIKDKLFLDSGRDRKLVVAERVGNIVVATPDVDAIIEQINKHNIQSFSVDPFVKSHHVEENDNKQIDAVMDEYAKIANETGCAVDLAHHVRKPASGQNSAAGDINQARGASAISGAVRSARTISVMTDKEAEMVGVPIDLRNWYIRVDDAKGSMSPPATSAAWLQREGVTLDNGDEFEQGDSVGVVTIWTPPDAFDGISTEKAASLLRLIAEGLPDDVMFSKNKGKRWAGNVLMDNVLGMEEGRAKTIIKTWMKTEVLYEDQYNNSLRRADEKGLFIDWEKIPKVVE